MSVISACNLLVQQRLTRARPDDTETRHAVDRINGQTEAVGLVANRQFERRVDVALLLITANMYVMLMRAAVGETVDQPRIGVEVEDDRLARGEERFEFAIGQPVRVLRVWHQLE